MADKPFIYKRWDDGFIVRRMTLDDVKIVQKWYSGLCPTSCDLDIVMDICEPDGNHFYIGELNGEVIASCGKVPVDKDIVYGSYLYVEDKYRGFGYANRIKFEVAGKYDGDRIVCQDSHDELEAMNVRRGFKTAFQVNLYEGPAPTDMHKNGARSEARLQQVGGSVMQFICLARTSFAYTYVHTFLYMHAIITRSHTRDHAVTEPTTRPATEPTTRQATEPTYWGPCSY